MSLWVKVEASVARNVSRHDRAVHGERDQRAPVDPKVGLSALSGKVRALLPAGASTFLIPGKNVPRPFCALALAGAGLGFPVGNAQPPPRVPVHPSLSAEWAFGRKNVSNAKGAGKYCSRILGLAV